jgi:hypothetical protein
MRPTHLGFVCVLVLTCLAIVAGPAFAITTKYTESFTSKHHCDIVNTTALWDTVAGELKLPPFQPTLASSYNTPDYALGVAISGDYAYVADYGSGLQVINIANPSSPTLAGSYNTAGYAYGVAISGDYAYVADGPLGLAVINITNPSSPTLAGSYDTPGYARRVAISGDYAYVADQAAGLLVINITNPSSPTLAGSYDTPDLAKSAAISGDYAYVADGTSGLQVIKVYQRSIAVGPNVGRSLAIDDSDDIVPAVRLASVQTDSIRWEISADGGVNWTSIPRNNTWQAISIVGTDLVWRSTHYYVGGGINAICTDLSIEWLYSFPGIDAIADVGNDQGRQVRITWTRSGYDVAGSSAPITEYAIFRRIDLLTASSGPSGNQATEPGSQSEVKGDDAIVVYPPGDWDFVKTVPADCEDSYSTLVPTLADSTESDGAVYTAFFMRARTATPGIYYDSPVDSGYSVDNLAPAPPAGLVLASAISLAWDESEAADFKYFTVYGSAVPGLDTSATFIGYTTGTAMDVTGDVYEYYHVTASDFAGNEGEASTVSNGYAGVATGAGIPTVFALRQPLPNPFSSKASVAFDLPMGCAVSLKVFDAQGRQVRALANQAYPAGRHSVTWAGDDDAGKAVGSGVYFVRMEAGGFKATSKVLLAR